MTDWAELDGAVEDVAPRLLGAVLRRGGVAVRITEVEAYGGADDPGSHAWRGRTVRNAAMFGPPGWLYCYLSYGIHVCANVVVGAPDHAAAVLLRAGEVVAGVGAARARRPGVRDRDLARGPACLTRALGIELADDGSALSSGPVRLEIGSRIEPRYVASGPRVGLTRAAERPWRHWLAADPTVSRYRRSARASRAVAADQQR